jgi:hypothetical protein
MMNYQDDNSVSGTPEERILLFWLLTREMCSLNKKHDAERRLQKHLTHLIRRES